MSFSFGSAAPAQTAPGFGATPAKTGFGTGFGFGGTPATSAPTGFSTFGSSFGTPASSTAPGFGTTFGTPASSVAAPGFGSTFGTPAPATATANFGTAFGTPAVSGATPGFGTTFATPSTSAPPFGAFNATTTVTPAGFGSTFSTPASNAVTGFGTPSFGAPTTSTGFTFSSFGNPATTTNLFSGFGTTNTTSAPSFGGFGTGTTLTGSTAFGGFGTNTFGGAATSTLGSFGTAFGGKPIASTGFTGFGANTALGQLQQPTQQQIDPNTAVYNSIFNCNVFGDERDAILAKWNLLQASWGTGKGFYSQSQPPVEYTQNNPYCRFKAIGYSVIPGHDNKEGLVAIVLNKKETEVKAVKDQLVTTLNNIMGNKPNLTISVQDIRAISDNKTQVLIYVQEKGMTGTVRKIPSTDLGNYLLQPMQKQQLVSLGTDNVFAHVMPDSDQLKEYLSKPPQGVDIRIWKQAQLDNPNPEKYIPVPLVGFEQLKWRSKCQEKETALHRGFLEQVGKDITELKRRHAASLAQIADQKRKLLNLQHRVLQIIVKQEVTRKAGMALQPEEELLRGQLENMQTQINIPTQFKGRLSEMLAQIRMQNQNGQIPAQEKYSLDPSVQEDVKQFLRMEQNGITHLVEIINTDLSHLKIIRDGMQEIIDKQH